MERVHLPAAMLKKNKGEKTEKIERKEKIRLIARKVKNKEKKERKKFNRKTKKKDNLTNTIFLYILIYHLTFDCSPIPIKRLDDIPQEMQKFRNCNTTYQPDC